MRFVCYCYATQLSRPKCSDNHKIFRILCMERMRRATTLLLLFLSASDIFTIQRGCKIHTHKEIASVAATDVRLDKCTCKLMSREGGRYALRTYVRATENGFTRCEAKLWKVVCIGYGNVQHDPFGLFDQFIICCCVGTST